MCDGWREETHLYRPLSTPTSDLGGLETSGEDGGGIRIEANPLCDYNGGYFIIR